MRAVRLGLAGCVVAWVLGGCLMDNISPTERLHDAVQRMNDAARWGRLDVAAGYVHPAYRNAFRQRHSGWGKELRVADTELLHLNILTDNQGAMSLVTVSWYRPEYMSLHQTVLRQHWRLRDGHYALADEEVVEGDAALLVPPRREHATHTRDM